MQNLEKFFGFRVELSDEFDAARIEVLNRLALRILFNLDDYRRNSDRFFVYYHQLGILLNEDYWAKRTTLQERIDFLRLTFESTQKQQLHRKIKFYNYVVDQPSSGLVECIPLQHKVIYRVAGEYFAARRSFRSELITFVEKSLRVDHRKIKVSVQAYPTQSHEQRLKNHGAKMTSLDLRFDRFTPVSIPSLGSFRNEVDSLSKSDILLNAPDTTLEGDSGQDMNKVFVSYSHKDAKWLEELKITLQARIRDKELMVWDDQQIKAGDLWRSQIENSLNSASVAVLLVSRYFFASDFIAKNELPPLLEAAAMRGLRILWIAVSASDYQHSPLAAYQALNDPNAPLDCMKRSELNKELVRIGKTIHDLAGG